MQIPLTPQHTEAFNKLRDLVIEQSAIIHVHELQAIMAQLIGMTFVAAENGMGLEDLEDLVTVNLSLGIMKAAQEGTEQ